eukprot:9502421-Pyramimonas_sp.AAC.1
MQVSFRRYSGVFQNDSGVVQASQNDSGVIQVFRHLVSYSGIIQAFAQELFRYIKTASGHKMYSARAQV